MVILFVAVHPLTRVASGFGYSQPEARTALRRKREVTAPLMRNKFHRELYQRVHAEAKRTFANELKFYMLKA
jgi:hypothetical protein